MKIRISILFLFYLLSYNTIAQTLPGVYRIRNEKSKILSPSSTVIIKENNIVFIKAFFHAIGWKTYRGVWKRVKDKIRISNLYDTAGLAPPKERLIIENGNLVAPKDSIKITVSDIADFTTIEPAEITINDQIKIYSKNGISTYIKFVAINKILVKFWGIKDSVIYKSPQYWESINIKIINSPYETPNYYHKDIDLIIKKGNLYLSDKSKLYLIKQ